MRSRRAPGRSDYLGALVEWPEAPDRAARRSGRESQHRPCGRRPLLSIVDGVHGFGVDDIDAATLGGDFFVASAHKWLFAPRGTGLIWGRAEAWPAIRPTIPTFDPTASRPSMPGWRCSRRPQPAPHSSLRATFGAYEHQFAIPAAVDFHRQIGRSRIAARLGELNGRVREALAKMRGVTLHTPLDGHLAAGITCFQVAGYEPGAVVAKLAEAKIHATTSPYKVSYARLAAGIMNRPEEIDTALAAVRALARA